MTTCDYLNVILGLLLPGELLQEQLCQPKSKTQHAVNYTLTNNLPNSNIDIIKTDAIGDIDKACFS